MKKVMLLCTMLTAQCCMVFVGAQATDLGKVSKAGSTNASTTAGLAIQQDRGFDIKAEIAAVEAEALATTGGGLMGEVQREQVGLSRRHRRRGALVTPERGDDEQQREDRSL